MRTLLLLLTLLVGVSCGPRPASETIGFALADAPFEHPDHRVVVGMQVGKLHYDTAKVTVTAGCKVHLTLRNPDTLKHNFILCAGGKEGMIAVVEAANALGDQAIAKAFIPDHPNVLLASKLLGQKETQDLYFHAPKKPGDYHYVCTFPGHALLMRGVLTVSAP